MIRLDIFSDPVCPWCYIGKANLDRALARAGSGAGDNPFEIEWHPFQLNPDMPRQGADRRSWFAERFGDQDRIDAMQARVTEIARAAVAAIRVLSARISGPPDRVGQVRSRTWPDRRDRTGRARGRRR